MKDHLNKDSLRFLKELGQNNNRDWFEQNKTRYQAAQADLIAFIETLIPEIASFDKGIAHIEAKKTVFRIYRDVRFSKDKRPYKTNLGSHLQGGTKQVPKAGYYLHLEPGNSFLAGGAYLPRPEWLKAIRSEIHYNSEELKDVLNSKEFKQYFGELEGERLKRAPKDYSIDHPEIELLRYKSFLAVHKVTDKQVNSPGFLKHCKDVFQALQPLDAYLNMALD